LNSNLWIFTVIKKIEFISNRILSIYIYIKRMNTTKVKTERAKNKKVSNGKNNLKKKKNDTTESDNDDVEEMLVPVQKNGSTKKVKETKKKNEENKSKSNKGGLRDLQKIIDDPEEYARNVTVERLVTILQKMSDYYYSEPRPLVEDTVYDVMLDVLKERDPDNAFLFQTGVTKTTEKDVKLKYPMPSLNKIKPGEKPLRRWFATYKGPYVVMDKLDGISVQIYKDEYGNVDIFTKKQTVMGTSKKHMLEYLVDQKVLDKIPKGTSIRGEVVISKKDFEKIKTIDPELKNPRSTMAGLMNTEKIDKRIASNAQLITYNILHPRYKISEQLSKLKKLGFKTVWNKKLDESEFEKDEEDNEDEEEDEGEDEEEQQDNNDNTDSHSKTIESVLGSILNERVSKSDFLVDGIVIADDSEIYEHTESNPKDEMAFKMNSTTNMKDAVVEEVEWNATMYGNLQPRIRIDPIILPGNTTVTYVTAHNAKYVQENNIGKGAIIKIVRSGDVIPYIVSIVKPANEPDMPDVEYEWDKNEVDVHVVNPDDDTTRQIEIRQNLHFFRKLGVKFLSEGIITKLYDAAYDTVISIVKSASEKNTKLYKISGLGEKMVTKIYDQIDKAFSRIKLADLMAGSLKFGEGLGSRKINEVIKIYPDILNMKDDSEEKIKKKILEVPGFSNILATKFSENLKSFVEFLEELRESCSYDLSFEHKKGKINKKNDMSEEEEEEEEEEEKAVDMSNQKIVMTGFRSAAITDFVEKNGGKISTSVSKNTTLVIYAETEKGDSGKLTKAQELQIPIITRSEFEKRYNIE
jgi:DNA ligase (NAD+)